MKLADPRLLARYMTERDITGAQLGRRAGVSRQYIWKLIHNERTSCVPDKAAAIEKALDLLPGTLFQPDPTHPPPRAGRSTRKAEAAA